MAADQVPPEPTGATPPTEAAGAASSSAIGAPAPLDNVVSFEAASRRGERQAASADSVSSPQSPQKSAAAHSSGEGERKGGKGRAPKGDAAEKKTEKTIDWGKFNHLIEKFALIYGTDTVWDGGERMIMKISNMAHAHGSDMVRMWKASEKRRTVRLTDVVFDPTMQADPDRCVNLYSGLAMEPREGDVGPAIELVRYLTSRVSDDGAECDDVMHWLLCWLAYPLQHPGTKLKTAVVMHGDEGAGKNFLFDMVVEIYGRYGALVGQDELEDKFNDWRSCKQFVVGDEVSSRAELVHNKNRLKALITSPTVQINPKNLPRREEKNHINIVFLSNELQPLALDNSDRRYLVVYTPRAHDFSFYKRLGEWRANGGVEAFYHHLLHYPLDGFDPQAPAPMTEAKTALIGLNRKSPEQFWLEWSSEELDLPYWSCSVAQTYRAYLRWCTGAGERFPFKREAWTATVQRFAESQGKTVQVKVMKPETAGTKKSARMFLVTKPPDEAQGAWATEAIKKFDEHLDEFHRWRGKGGDPGPSGGDQ